eukprot:2562915-Prymnesium_polylepis.2
MPRLHRLSDQSQPLQGTSMCLPMYLFADSASRPAFEALALPLLAGGRFGLNARQRKLRPASCRGRPLGPPCLCLSRMVV